MPHSRLLCLALAPAILAAPPLLTWSDLPPLPRAIGGQFAGVSGGALLVAGGSYFDVCPAHCGVKIWVDSVYILAAGSDHWQSAKLPRPLAYGGSVTTPDGVILIGGGDRDANTSEVLRLRWVNGKLTHELMQRLPVPLANSAAALLGSTVFVAGGQQTTTATEASAALYALDLSQQPPHWVQRERCPGPGRILPTLVAQGSSVYLFSGASLSADTNGKARRTYLRDAWRYTPGSGWFKLPEIPEVRVAAPGIAARQSRILLLGGDDGRYAARAQELGDRHPGFRRDVLVFDTALNRWTHEGSLPVGLVTTTAVLWNGSVVIPGGEDRPGHRSARVLKGVGQTI